MFTPVGVICPPWLLSLVAFGVLPTGASWMATLDAWPTPPPPYDELCGKSL